MCRKWNIVLLLLLAVTVLSGCAMTTVDQMYSLPKRSAEFQQLQSTIDGAMVGLEYSAPLSGENRQTVQMADLDGDGKPEYLLFAKGAAENPMQILIFKESGGNYFLMQSIKNPGAAFSQIEYVNLDDEPGMELVVGLRLGDQVLRYLSVYSFSGGDCRQLMSANYSRFLPTDLDSSGQSELLVISDGEVAEEVASAALYRYVDGTMVRSKEASLSVSSDRIKRIMVSSLHGGQPAVYVAGAVGQNAIITDVLALHNGVFCNISLSNESGTSVQTMRNYNVYADDIDNDGTLELPELITMAPVEDSHAGTAQHLIRWFAINQAGEEITKMHTFHDFDGGWYLHLADPYATRVNVVQQGRSYAFYIWDEAFAQADKVFTIFTFNGPRRQEQAQEDGKAVLCKTDGITYAVKLEAAAAGYGITANYLNSAFHLIHLDWKFGEIE